MIKQIKIALGVVVVVVVMACVSFYNNNTQEKTGKIEPIKLGAIYALSGPASKFGEISMRGVNDAVAYFKENNKEIEVSLIVEDSQGDPKQAVSSANKLFSVDGVKFAVVGMSAVSASVAPVADRYKSLVISDAALYGLTKDKEYVFQNFMPSLNEVSVQVNKNKSWKKVAIVYINDDFGYVNSESIKNQINSDRTIETYSFEKTTTDFKTSALKIKQFKPDVVVILGYGPALNQALKDMQLQKVSAEYITYLACTLPGVLSDKNFSLDGQFSYEFPDIKDSAIMSWVKSKGGEENTFYTIAFENTLIALNVAKDSENNPQEAISLLKSRDFNLLYGVGRFNNNGVVNRDLSPEIIHNGKCESIAGVK